MVRRWNKQRKMFVFNKVVYWHLLGQVDNLQTSEFTQGFVYEQLLKSAKFWLRHSKVKSWTYFCQPGKDARLQLCVMAKYLPSARRYLSYGHCLEVKREYIRTALCWIVWHNVHSQQHTYMSSSYRSNKLVLSHWNPYAMRWGSCLELYYRNMVEWFWWDSSLISTTNWFNHPRNDL